MDSESSLQQQPKQLTSASNYSENFASFPPKETVRVALATLGLVDEKDPSLSSIVVVNSSLLRTRYFSPIWRVLMVYIVKCLGESLILSSERVNADDTTDKSLSGTSVLPVNHPKTLTDKKSRKKKNPSSSQPKTLRIVKELSPLKQVAETQHAEEPVTTADATKSVDASESAEELGNQPKPADAEKGAGLLFMDQEMTEVDYDLESMPDDEIEFVYWFEADDDDDDEDDNSKNKEELSKTDEAAIDNTQSTNPTKVDKSEKDTKAAVPNLILKPLNKEFNALNTLESRKFVILQKKLSKAIEKTVGKSVKSIFPGKYVLNGKSASNKAFNTAAAKEEKESQQKSTLTKYVPSPAQGEQVVNDSTNTEVPAPAQGEQESADQIVKSSTALVIHSNEEPHVKKLKVVLDEATYAFYGTRRFTPKISNLYQFSAAGEGPLSIEEAKAQIEEIKRLAELKAEKEKTEKRLKKVMTPDELRAHAEGLATYEAKKENMLEEYNHCISFRADPLPITKISYRIKNSTNEACMRITRNHQPLNLTMYEKFVLKMLGFSECLELHDLASKGKLYHDFH
ncbi:hypothetical protein Tco_0923977 [Tanacetum coccineum]|uniref:Uncharacterized protein n=1 Tax=Tanacetum coccineum TaxID=301880 RepID=A0ABQ5D4S8_9ASTR